MFNWAPINERSSASPSKGQECTSRWANEWRYKKGQARSILPYETMILPLNFYSPSIPRYSTLKTVRPRRKLQRRSNESYHVTMLSSVITSSNVPTTSHRVAALQQCLIDNGYTSHLQISVWVSINTHDSPGKSRRVRFWDMSIGHSSSVGHDWMEGPTAREREIGWGIPYRTSVCLSSKWQTPTIRGR